MNLRQVKPPTCDPEAEASVSIAQASRECRIPRYLAQELVKKGAVRVLRLPGGARPRVFVGDFKRVLAESLTPPVK